jgi:hypothetical protein
LGGTTEERLEEVAELAGIAGRAELVADVAARATEPREPGERRAGRARAPPGGRTGRGARPRVRLPILPEAVVQRPLVGIRQDGVRLVHGLEPSLRLGIALVPIRVMLPRSLAKGLLDLCG